MVANKRQYLRPSNSPCLYYKWLMFSLGLVVITNNIIQLDCLIPCCSIHSLNRRGNSRQLMLLHLLSYRPSRDNLCGCLCARNEGEIRRWNQRNSFKINLWNNVGFWNLKWKRWKCRLLDFHWNFVNYEMSIYLLLRNSCSLETVGIIWLCYDTGLYLLRFSPQANVRTDMQMWLPNAVSSTKDMLNVDMTSWQHK